MTLNVHIFTRLLGKTSRFGWAAGAIAALVSQLVDTLVFITIAFVGVRPIGALILGQALAKVTLSIVLVPALIALFVWSAGEIERRGGAGRG
jgi:uncharacterized PurR-regulated membrane protein YhhQ (DUF165 family)